MMTAVLVALLLDAGRSGHPPEIACTNAPGRCVVIQPAVLRDPIRTLPDWSASFGLREGA